MAKSKTELKTKIQDRILVKDIHFIGHVYTICGFVHRIRDHGKIVFLEVRDITGIIQVVVIKEEISALVWDKVKKLTRESAICVTGVAQKPQDKLSAHLHTLELLAQDLQIHSLVKTPLPFEPSDTDKVRSKIRFDYRWLDLRDNKKRLIFQIWTVMEKAFTEFLRKQDFIQIHTPKIMPVASEGQDELFYIDYFGKKAYLAQSAQFYKQMGIVSGFEKVFHIGPVFRATHSFTTRHDTEFTQYDVEMAWVDYTDLMDLEEDLIIHILQEIKGSLGTQISSMYNIEIKVPKKPFPKLKLSEAKKLLSKVQIKTRKHGDLSPEEERKLGEITKEKYGHDFVFITHYPKSKRAFYHMAEKENADFAAGFDLIYKGVEITTGSEREHRVDYLKKYAKERGEDMGALQQYFQFFEYGVPPHGGFGFGPSRFIKQLLNLPHVKEATFLPRLVNRLAP